MGPTEVERVTDGGRKLRACYLAVIVTLSILGGSVAFAGTGVAFTKSAGNVAVGTSENVDVADATIDPSNESKIPVAINVSDQGLQPDQIELRVENEGTGETLNTTLLSEADFDSNASEGNVTLPTSVHPGPSFTLNVTAYDDTTGQPISGATDTSTITVEDNTAPTITDVEFTNDGFDRFWITFNSSEQLGFGAGSLDVSVSGPGSKTYSFTGDDFGLVDSSENFTYQLFATQSFDDGEGTYTAAINTALDPAGNDGGDASINDDYTHSDDFSSKTVTHVGGPALDTSKVTMFTSKMGSEFVIVQLENSSANFDRRDLSGEGATEETELWVNFTVADFNPDVLMGTANVDGWQYTMNPDGSANVNVSLKPASTERNFSAWDDGVFDPSNWGPGYDGSDLSMDAVVDFGLGNLSAGGPNAPRGLDGARLTTDAQAYTVPQLDGNDNLVVDVASPHCVAGTAPPANQCSGADVNDGGFYEAVLPAAFYQAEWGIAELSPGDVSVDYSSSGSAAADPQWDVSVRDDGALVVNGSNLHYSAGTVQISRATNDGGGGGSAGSSSSTSSTESTITRTDDGTVATIESVSLDDPTVSIPVEDVRTDAIAVEEVTATFDMGTNADNTISIDASDSPPADTPSSPTDRTLGYVTIEVEGNLEDSVAEGTFTLDLSDSDVDPDDVTAYRYRDGEWEEVDTETIDDTTVTVTTPGYSVFAIGVDDSARSATTPSTPTETASPTPTPTEADSGSDSDPATTTATESSTESGGQPGFGVGSVLVAVVTVAVWMTRREV